LRCHSLNVLDQSRSADAPDRGVAVRALPGG